MADPLSILRQHTINGKEAAEKDDNVIIGEFAWRKNVKTNYMVYGSGKDGGPKDYYTLECLVFLLKNVLLSHPVYVRRAAAENIPVVTRPDRKDILAYLKGETTSSNSIDKSAPLEIPTQIKRAAEEPVESTAKKPRFEETHLQKVKDVLAARLDAPREASVAINNITKSLSDAMSLEKIAEIKAKRLSKKRTTIKGHDDIEMGSDLRTILDYDLDVTKDIVSRERQWRTRTTILLGGKQFPKSVMNYANALIKNPNDGKPPPPVIKAVSNIPGSVTTPRLAPSARQIPQAQVYNRYDQERFKGKEETEGFKIDTLGTYHGMTLKSVTEANTPKKPPQPVSSNPAPPSSVNVPGKSPMSPSTNKRISRTPIIIIPGSNTALVTMYNAKELLQDLKYIPTEDKRGQGAKRDNEILIHRQRNGVSVPYRVIDNPLKLEPSDWERVVAVFVMGPAWQFKGYPYEGNPVEIFSKICAFHLKYDEMKLDANVAKWAVHVIQLSRNKRHLDRAALMTFWEKLDAFIAKSKSFLRF